MIVQVRNLTAKNMPFLNWLSNKTGSTYGDMFSLGGIYNGFFIQVRLFNGSFFTK
jgi:hypothetical protein